MNLDALKQQLEPIRARLLHEWQNNEQVQRAKHWYEALSARDRWVVKAVGWLLLLAFIFMLVYAPLLSSYRSAEAQLKHNLATYNLIAKNAGKFGRASSGGGQESLLAVTMQQAQKTGIALSRYEQDGQSLRIWLDRAAFDEAIVLFEALQAQGVHASQISVDQTDRVGRVDIRATLVH